MTREESPARYVCKRCGGESPAGIGYVCHTFGPLPSPAAQCPNPHVPPVRGCWDPVTRGFWEGGAYVAAGDLTIGDVFRVGTYSGYVVAADPVLRPAQGDWRPESLHVPTTHGTQILSPSQPLERMPR
jgi:hypothetical protein